MSGEIVKVGSTVRRPTGPHTETIHRFLDFLHGSGFAGSPEVYGIDGRGREILDYIEGPVVWPESPGLVSTDDDLEEVASTISEFHSVSARFVRSPLDSWSNLASDRKADAEVICHNDIAPWNLIRAERSWAFIDWDLAAPGRRIWDLAWTAHTLIPLWPDSGLINTDIARRLRVFLVAYGIRASDWSSLFGVVIERTGSMAQVITSKGGLGEEPFATLLRDGHAEAWQRGCDHVVANWRQWLQLMESQ